MKNKIKVYVASNKRFIPYWQSLKKGNLMQIMSTWIDKPNYDGTGLEDITHPALLSRLWTDIFSEIRESDILLARVDETDTPRGVLIEIGAMLVLGKPVYVMGSLEPIGDVVHHSLVFKIDSPKDAMEHFAGTFTSADFIYHCQHNFNV